MRTWAFASVAVLSLGVLTACSSKKVTTTGTGGSGGTGTTTSTTSTTSTSTTSTSTTSTSTTSTSTTTTSTSTTTSSGGTCDNTGTCGDSMSGCIGCALAGNCSGQIATCQGDMDCVAFAQCIGMCAQGDQACFDACSKAHMGGASLYNDLLVCVICQECPVDCDGPGSGCP